MNDRTKRQNLGIEKWRAFGCRGSCLYCTGFGKTTVALRSATRFLNKNKTAKVLVVVPTDYLKEQWLEQIIELGLFDNITVRIINTVVKESWDVDLLILDELHLYASESFIKVFERVKYKLILGLTGTLDRLDGKEVLLKEKCPVIDEITTKEAIEKGWLSPYKEYKVLLDVNLTDYNNANQDFLKYFSVFNFDFNLAMNCVTGEKKGTKVIKPSHLVRYEYAKKRCTLPLNHPQYTSTVKALHSEITASAFGWSRSLKIRKDFVMSHPKKLEITRMILNARKDSKAITFSATIKDAEAIGIGYVLHSGKTKKKRGIIATEFNLLEKGVLNTSKSLDVGADIPGLNLGVILCNVSSSIQKKQRLKA